MNYVVTPFSHEHGSGGGGDCNGYCFTKVTVCNIYSPCGTHCNKVECLIRF